MPAVVRARQAKRKPRPSSRIAGPVLRECHDCGLFQTLQPLADGDAADCRRCHATLRHGRVNSLNRTLACVIAALVLYVMAIQLPFFYLRTVGRVYESSLFTGPRDMGHDGDWEVSAVVLVTLILMPLVQILLRLIVLLGLRLERPPKFLPLLFGWVTATRPWSMVEVFLLGSFVAYTRLKAIAEVEVGGALIALGGVMLCMIAADAELDEEQVWDAMERSGLDPAPDPPSSEETGGHALIGCDTCHLVLRAPPGYPCPRCGRRLRFRKPQSLLRCTALLTAAAALYLPANIYPVMTVTRFGHGEPNTILSGVIELIDDQMWPLAILVFSASLMVPILKLVSLALMVVTAQRGSVTRLRDRTRLYRLVDSIGRWSMIDVFMITILVGLVHMGFIANILPGTGAIAFAAVVILTMFAAACFDPRIMWDRAAAAGHDLDAEDLESAGPGRLRERRRLLMKKLSLKRTGLGRSA
jgi:paraquat-inducible protein A